MTSERRKWEDRYRTGAFEPPEEPSDYLASRIPELPDGRALDAATGLGRNARLLADHGYTVDAVDISREALSRARRRETADDAADRIDWIRADLGALPLRPGRYAVVAVSYFYGPDVVPDLVASLAPGGRLVYEHHVVSDAPDLRGPSERYRYDRGELLDLCRDLRILDYEESHERDDDGRVSAVARLTAVRPIPDGDRLAPGGPR